MLDTHLGGDIGEIRIASEAMKRNYRVAFPYGHDRRYDLIVDRLGKLERVQVKTAHSTKDVLKVHTRSLGKKDGKQIVKTYSQEEVDWFAVVDTRTDKCYFIPINDAAGKDAVCLRFTPTKNNQQKGIKYAKDYEEW